MKVKEVGSTIRNHIGDGLSGEIPTTSYSREQLIDEAFLFRNRIIWEFSLKGKINLIPFYQTIDSIPIEEFDLSQHKIIKSGICRNYVDIPALAPTNNFMSIEYLGPVSKAKSFKLYYDTKFNDHSGRMRTARNPFSYIDMNPKSDGYIKAMLFNLDEVKNLRYVSVRGIWANPLKLKNFDCCEDIDEMEFPAPLAIQDMIIEKIVEKYVRQYRQMNIPDFPNKLTDING